MEVGAIIDRIDSGKGDKMETKNEETETKTDKRKFWALFSAWSLFACVLPVAFIAWRYDLFTKISSVQFGGWGMIAVLIIAVFAIVCFKYVSKGLIKWSMTKQVVSGACKIVVPLLALYFVLYSISSSIALFLEALKVVIACEAIAIPINPFPKWVYESTMGTTDSALEYLFERHDKKGGK